MVKDSLISVSQDDTNKAGYNQAGEIARILSMLRLTFTSAMLRNPNDFFEALEACRASLNIISGKVKEKEIKEIDKDIFSIEERLPLANQTFTNGGTRFFKHPKARIQLKRDLEKLWRKLEQTQDEYGYGMFSEDDSGL